MALIEVTLKWSIGYDGKYYGPGTVKVPVGLAKQIGQYDPEKVELPEAEANKARITDLEAEVATLKAQLAAKTDDGGEETPLPEEFVNKTVRELLLTAGYSTLEKVQAATDEELIALDGIAEATLQKVREASKE